MTGKKGPPRPWRLNVNMSVEERATVEGNAARLSMTTSEFVRMLVRDYAKRNRNDRKGG